MQMLARRPNHKVTQIHPNINMNSGSTKNSSAVVQWVRWFRSFSEGKVVLSRRNLERSLGDTSDIVLRLIFTASSFLFFFFLYGWTMEYIWCCLSMEAIHQIFLSSLHFFTHPHAGLHIKVTSALQLTLKGGRNLKRTKIDDISVISKSFCSIPQSYGC